MTVVSCYFIEVKIIVISGKWSLVQVKSFQGTLIIPPHHWVASCCCVVLNSKCFMNACQVSVLFRPNNRDKGVTKKKNTKRVGFLWSFTHYGRDKARCTFGPQVWHLQCCAISLLVVAVLTASSSVLATENIHISSLECVKSGEVVLVLFKNTVG